MAAPLDPISVRRLGQMQDVLDDMIKEQMLLQCELTRNFDLTMMDKKRGEDHLWSQNSAEKNLVHQEYSAQDVEKLQQTLFGLEKLEKEQGACNNGLRDLEKAIDALTWWQGEQKSFENQNEGETLSAGDVDKLRQISSGLLVMEQHQHKEAAELSELETVVKALATAPTHEQQPSANPVGKSPPLFLSLLPLICCCDEHFTFPSADTSLAQELEVLREKLYQEHKAKQALLEAFDKLHAANIKCKIEFCFCDLFSLLQSPHPLCHGFVADHTSSFLSHS